MKNLGIFCCVQFLKCAYNILYYTYLYYGIKIMGQQFFFTRYPII